MAQEPAEAFSARTALAARYLALAKAAFEAADTLKPRARLAVDLQLTRLRDAEQRLADAEEAVMRAQFAADNPNS